MFWKGQSSMYLSVRLRRHHARFMLALAFVLLIERTTTVISRPANGDDMQTTQACVEPRLQCPKRHNANAR